MKSSVCTFAAVSTLCWLVKGRKGGKESTFIFTFTAVSTPLLHGAAQTDGHVVHLIALGTRRTVGRVTDRSLCGAVIPTVALWWLKKKWAVKYV